MIIETKLFSDKSIEAITRYYADPNKPIFMGMTKGQMIRRAGMAAGLGFGFGLLRGAWNKWVSPHFNKQQPPEQPNDQNQEVNNQQDNVDDDADDLTDN